jgi:glycosyltransferase involved in cell wall biosynthesis
VNKTDLKILAIIPAFNEEKSILIVVNSIKKSNQNIDILVVNDKSLDATEKILIENSINHLSLPINLGIGGAVQSGFLYAQQFKYDVAVQVDGDGQHPAAEIQNLLNPIIKNGVDFVIGSRYQNSDQIVSSRARKWGGGLLSFLIFLLTRKHISDPTSGFRAYNRRTINYLCSYYPQEYPEPISVLELLDNGFNFSEVPVLMKEREFGTSSITGINTLFYMIKVMFAIVIAKLRRGGYLCQNQ